MQVGQRGQRKGLVAEHSNRTGVASGDGRLDLVHRRRAKKARNKGVGGVQEQFHRGADLFDAAVVHDDDLVGQRHGLDLVVGDVDAGDAKAFVQALNLGAHLGAQFCVKVGQRFVEQEHFGAAHNRAAHGDTLALAAGQVGRAAFQIIGQAKDAADFFHRGRDVFLAFFADFQAKGDVVGNVQVRVKRVVLEHHRHVAIFGGGAVHDAPVDRQLAARDFL